MFDKITIRSVAGPSQNMDAGTLAEVLLFYGKVHLIIDPGRLSSLVSEIGVENIEFLIDNRLIDISFVSSTTGVSTTKYGPLELHEFVQFELAGKTPDRPRKLALEEHIAIAFERSAASHPNRRRVAKKLALLSEKRRSYESLLGREENISREAIKMLQDQKLLTDLMNVCISKLIGWKTIPRSHFRLISEDRGFLIDSSLNLGELNNIYRERVPESNSTLNRAYLLSFIYDSIIDLNLASRYGSELLTGPIQRDLIEARVAGIFSRLNLDRQGINEFSEFVFEDGRSIRSSINSGARKFDDIRPIILKSRKFRDWMDGINPDRSLLKAYHEAVTAETWIDKLPAKSTRFAIFTGLGVISDLALTGGLGTAVGLGLGSLDTFLVDQLVRGWSPNQFVDLELKPFVSVE